MGDPSSGLTQGKARSRYRYYGRKVGLKSAGSDLLGGRYSGLKQGGDLAGLTNSVRVLLMNLRLFENHITMNAMYFVDSS